MDECVTEIREHHRIDILVDLNGYTEGHRLDVFARNPAPIQVAYLGFPNTVGSNKLVQYRITDRIADLPKSQQWYAEQRLYLPRGFLLYQSMVQDRPLNFLNSQSPLFPWVVLGAMNRESKNSDEVMTCWRAILQRAPNTKLLIKLSTVDDDEVHMTKYREFMGVDPSRVLFAKYGSTAEYYQLYSCLDVVLDTFPYSGTTTTCNALYNSVPVVTMIHRDLHAHNVSASLLTHAGLSELVAQNPDDYVNKVVELVTNDTERLVRYRGNEHGPGTVHHQFAESMRPEPFMQDYESLFKGLIEKKEVNIF
jgi:predicted O-linked N-acetylglucosamine transferase (SPINDLY family)